MIIETMSNTSPASPAPAPPSPSVLIPASDSLSGVARLSHLGVIRAVGPDAAAFLQGQLTQDVVSMGLNTARLAAFCNAKGRMQASFVVFKCQTTVPSDTGPAGDEFLMVCSADILPQTLKRLSMFVMRAKVKLTDATPDFNLYGLVGDAIKSVADSVSNTWAKQEFKGQTSIFLHPGAGQDRVLLCAAAGALPPAGPDLPIGTWNWLEVHAGVAMITPPIFEAFVPQMLNYESVGGVSFKKGCYPGQEVVARSQFRGTLKRRAYLVHSPHGLLGDMHVGQEVYHADQACGMVAACAVNPVHGFDAIVSMQTSAATGGVLTCGSPHGNVLTLLPLPYPLLDDI